MAFLVFALGILMVSGSAAAKGTGETDDPNYPNDPEKLVRVKWDATIRILQSKKLDEKVKGEKIKKIVSPAFDFELMGKLALGRVNWPKLDKEQQEQYIKLFRERLVSSYIDKIGLYRDETVVLKKAIKKPNKTVEVPTEVLKGDNKYIIIYKLRQNGKKWQVYDVEIQGVSILLTYRSQFDDVLRRNSVEEFLKMLEQPPDKNTPGGSNSHE